MPRSSAAGYFTSSLGCQTEDYEKDLIDKGKSPEISVIVFEICTTNLDGLVKSPDLSP